MCNLCAHIQNEKLLKEMSGKPEQNENENFSIVAPMQINWQKLNSFDLNKINQIKKKKKEKK